MSNPFYERLYDVLPLSFARSAAVEAEFERIEQGFDSASARFSLEDAYNNELVAARQGQASLLENIQRYLSTSTPATASLNMGGFSVTNAGAAQASTDLVTFAQLVAATTPGNLPAAPSDTFGLSLTNREGTASYSLSTADALALSAMGIV